MRPVNAGAVSGLFYTYSMSGQLKEGIALLETWLLTHPRDNNARQELSRMKARLEASVSGTVPADRQDGNQ